MSLDRRTLLRAAAAVGAVSAAGAALSACDADSPGFIDVSSPDLLLHGGIVRLTITETGTPAVLSFGTTAASDGDVSVAVESVGHTVVLGPDRVIADGSFTHTVTVARNRPTTLWARALAAGEPGRPGDTLRVTTRYGEIQLQVWIEPTRGGWRPVGTDTLPSLGIVAVHAALMRTGAVSEILTFSPPRVLDTAGHPQHTSDGHEQWDLGALHQVEIMAVDPVSLNARPRPQNLSPTVNLFCVGQAHMPLGQLLTAGGHISVASITDPSANYLHIYDANSAMWRRSAARMRHHRWYPTVTVLPDGRMLITSGSSQAMVGDGADFFTGVGFYAHLENNYEIYDPAGDRMVDLGRDPSPRLVDMDGEETFPVAVVTPPFLSIVHRRPLGTYPAVFVLPGGPSRPGGVIVLQEAHRGWYYEYRAGEQPPLVRAPRRYEMPARASRSYPHYGSAVLLRFADGDTAFRVLVVGGADEARTDHTDHPDEGPATATTVIVDYDSTQALDRQRGFRRAGPMRNARTLCDATLLPDGQVLVTGGVSKGWTNHSYVRWAVREAELFDPRDETFRPAAPARLDRRYHSTALLLQDGTVLKMGSTGGFAVGTGTGGEAWISSHTEAEIYHPPYAWRGPAPTMVFSGTGAGRVDLAYGGRLTVDVAGHAVARCTAVLMKAGAVTHGLDMDQRGVVLTIEHRTTPTAAAPGGRQRTVLSVRGPANAMVAPPGPYLLFVLDDFGVPSRGAWLLIG